ncbi:MAG: hypothetical protein Q9209_003816 [Squamulea sp. 1 TL-2023]
MTATIHSTSSSLTIPITQNTAPVLSYNCLYTHDLRRKAKRWQDGVLKYHTFNKRIMVYDVPRNFIGDTHWREPQALQDGDELELEKGVLIQVGEEVKNERTETDLTALLEKRKPKPASEGAKETLPNSPTTARTPNTYQSSSVAYTALEKPTPAPFSKLRPKSLNALLGKPKGPVGRATVPSKSPAEQRRDKENDHIDCGRSPKRRRLQHIADSSPTSAASDNRPVDPVSVTAERVTTSASASSTNKQSNNRDVEPAGNDRSRPKMFELPDAQSNNISKTRNQQGRSTSNQTSSIYPDRVHNLGVAPPLLATVRKNPPTSAGYERTAPKSSSFRQQNASHSNRDSQVPPGRMPQDQYQTSEVQRRGSETVENEPRPENLLRIISSKPRRKLMYRDLLPEKAPPQRIAPFANDQTIGGTASRRRSWETLDKRSNGTLTGFHQAQQDRINARLNKRRTAVEAVEDDDMGPELFLREDDGEDMYTPDKLPGSDGEDDPALSEPLFVAQTPQGDILSKTSSPHLDAPKDPSATRDTAMQLLSPRENCSEGVLNTPNEGSLSNQHQNLNFSESAFQVRSSPEEPISAMLDGLPDPENPPNEPQDTELVPTSTEVAMAVTDMDSQLLHTSMAHTTLDSQPRSKSQSKPGIEIPKDRPPPEPIREIIKAAMPPQPLSRSSRSLQRSVSDLASSAKPNTNRKRTAGFHKSYSNGFTTLNISKPTPPHRPPFPPIQVHSTNLYAPSANKNEEETLIPDSRPGSAKEQTVEPWSREAFDLFGFDGLEKRVGISNGVMGEKGGGVVRGEDGWLVESQGFV